MKNPFRKRGLDDILANFKSILDELEMLVAGCHERAADLYQKKEQIDRERDALLAEANKADIVKSNIRKLIKE